MLNKLLKRCMPWMDKGRWYKLVLRGNDTNYIVDNDLSDPIFHNAVSNFNNNEGMITIENPGAVFLESKCMIELGTALAGATLDIYSMNNILMIALPIRTVDVAPDDGIKITLWMFGR